MKSVWCLMDVTARGHYLLAFDEDRDALVAMLVRHRGHSVSHWDIFRHGDGFKIEHRGMLYTLRELPVGQWLGEGS